MQDVSDFTERVRRDEAWRAFLSNEALGSEIVVTRAPGRIDVMGSRGLKLQLRLNPIGRVSLCAPGGATHGIPACPP